jgi:hypothetical protein
MELEEAPMTIVMGFDQHRAQITTEWLDSMTGEIGRARIAPAHREGVRRFLARFAGQELEVALEATTGWLDAARVELELVPRVLDPREPILLPNMPFSICWVVM